MYIVDESSKTQARQYLFREENDGAFYLTRKKDSLQYPPILEKWVPLEGERAHLEFFKSKIEKRGDRTTTDLSIY